MLHWQVFVMQHEKKLKSSEHMVFVCNTSAQTASSSQRVQGAVFVELMLVLLARQNKSRFIFSRQDT